MTSIIHNIHVTLNAPSYDFSFSERSSETLISAKEALSTIFSKNCPWQQWIPYVMDLWYYLCDTSLYAKRPQRILKICYFRRIKPSDWNSLFWLHISLIIGKQHLRSTEKDIGRCPDMGGKTHINRKNTNNREKFLSEPQTGKILPWPLSRFPTMKRHCWTYTIYKIRKKCNPWAYVSQHMDIKN